MNKKITIIVLALILPLTAAAFPGGGEGRPQDQRANRVERLAKKLNLNADQQSKMDAIFKQQREKIQAIKEDTRTRMQDVLSSEQMNKFDVMKQQRKEKRQQRKSEMKNKKQNRMQQ